MSIEDSTRGKTKSLYDFDLAVERIRAARATIDRVAPEAMLEGRSEGFVAGAPDLDETIRRLRAYAAAGADCLYAPGVRTREQIAALVEAVAPKPLNLVVGWASDLAVKDIAALGVRRISVGCGLARVAWGGFMRTAKLLPEEGRFDGLAQAVPVAEINAFFAADRKKRTFLARPGSRNSGGHSLTSITDS